MYQKRDTIRRFITYLSANIPAHYTSRAYRRFRMTVSEAYQRGNNLVAVAIVALSGLAFLPEFFFETEGPFKIDEAVLFLLGVAAVAWYMMGRNKFSRSLVPMGLMIAALAVKVLGLILEIGDSEDAGDEYGALILFALATITVVWLYFRGASGEATSAEG
jgi:hypothetical protein